MSVAETAAALRLTENNEKVRLLRARGRLRNLLVGFAPQGAFSCLGQRCDQLVHNVLAQLE